MTPGEDSTLVETRRWRGGLVMGAVAVVVLALGLRLLGSNEDEETGGALTPATTGSTVAPTSPPPGADPPPVAHEVDALTPGPLLPATTGTALIVRDRVTNTTVVDLDAGTVRLLDREDPDLRFLRVDRMADASGTLVAVRGGRAVAFPDGLDGAETALGAGDEVYPATENRVWIVEDRAAGDRTRLSGIDGSVVTPPLDLPDESHAVGATSEGLLLATSSGIGLLAQSGSVADLGRGSPLAVGGDVIAVRDCADDGSCNLSLQPLNGPVRSVDLPGGVTARDDVSRAAFSPDGRSLAVPVAADGGVRLGTVDVERGRLTLVAGSGRLDRNGRVLWSPSGEWLFAETSDLGLLAWSTGAERARVTEGVDVRQLLAAVPAASTR